MSQLPILEQSRDLILDEVGAIDTTLLFHELKRTYAKTGDSVPVDFRRLVSWLKIGDQLTHHIHPYPAKLLPHIAHFFLRCNSGHPISHVLDPFCGSGTVALEASILGYTSFVADANPFASLLTNVKTTAYNVDALREGVARITERACRLRTAPSISVVNAEKWYTPKVKLRLEILLRAINEYDEPSIKNFFLVCFSGTARKLSCIDPAISVPVKLKPKNSFSQRQNEKILERLFFIENAKPADEFFRICHENIERVEVANRANPLRTTAIIVGNDARAIKADSLPAPGIPLIITSPPYGTAQKYVRASSLSLNWLGLAEPRQLSTLEGQSIGREHSPAYRNETGHGVLPEDFQKFIEQVHRINPLRSLITRQYLLELRAALTSMYVATSRGGRIVLVIGNNQVCGKTLFTNRYISEVMTELGCEHELDLVDQIKSRGLLTKRNGTASVIAKEYVLVFRKR
ncbi:hypothetical protein [Comamonas sp.]|uniref:hypothetical protein n=1 Tax=Comamonas sp. TaxID=34028 RepID=UPI00289EDEB6|nr:hypothetical protein [Comamonas sp.]